MSDYQNCYIAFLDLLGFKDIINGRSCQEIAQVFAKIKLNSYVIDDTTGQPLIRADAIQKKIMSDSICFYVNSNETNSLAGLIAICTYFQVRMLRCQEPILCRGAIVKGDIYANGDITFGPGLTNAYLLEEKVASTPRIILLKSVLDSRKNHNKSGEKYIKDYLFKDEDAFLALDYLFLYCGLCRGQGDWKNFVKWVKKD